MSTEEITRENNSVNEQILDYRRKNNLLRQLIEQMDTHYEDSKRYVVFQRYRLMKSMVKNITANKWL